MIKSYKKILGELIPYAAVIAVIVFFTIVSKGKLLSSGNIKTMTNQIFSILLISLGAMFIYAHGAMDLTIGGLLGNCMLIGSVVINATGTLFLSMIAILAVAVAVGAINGSLAANFNELSFLPSLCLMFILRGILQYVGNKGTIKIDGSYGVYDNVALKAVVLGIALIVAYYLFNYTKLGKYNRAIGGNQTASGQLGIPVYKYKVLAYTWTAFLVGIAGFFAMVRTRSVSAESGNGMEFDVMVALIFGGMPLSGGTRAKFHCAVLGCITATVLSNGMVLWGLMPGVVALVKGLFFLVLVYISYKKTKGVLPR